MDKQLRIERRKQAFTARIVVSAFLFVSIGSPYAQAQNKVREFRSSRVDKRPVLEFQSSGVEELKSLDSQTLKLSNSQTPKLLNSPTPQLSNSANYIACLQKLKKSNPADTLLQQQITEIQDMLQNRITLAEAVNSKLSIVNSKNKAVTIHHSPFTIHYPLRRYALGTYQGSQSREYFVVEFIRASNVQRPMLKT